MANKASTLRSRRLLLATGYATLVAGFVAFAVVPYSRGMSMTRGDILRSQQEIKARQDKTHDLESMKSRIHMIDLQTRNFDRLVPANQDLGPFIKELSQELADAGMGDISVGALQATSLGKSQRLPIEVHGRGTFTQLHGFLVRLENLQRMSSVGKLSIEADNDMNGKVTAQLTLYIYNTKTGS